MCYQIVKRGVDYQMQLAAVQMAMQKWVDKAKCLEVTVGKLEQKLLEGGSQS